MKMSLDVFGMSELKQLLLDAVFAFMGSPTCTAHEVKTWQPGAM